jgi:hypothetical protein
VVSEATGTTTCLSRDERGGDQLDHCQVASIPARVGLGWDSITRVVSPEFDGGSWARPTRLRLRLCSTNEEVWNVPGHFLRTSRDHRAGSPRTDASDSGRRGSNSRPLPWQGSALPLSYSRSYANARSISATVHRPRRDQTGCAASRRCEAIQRSNGSPDSNDVISAYRGFGPGLCTT